MTEESARTMLGLGAGAETAEIAQVYGRLKAQLEESLGRAPTPSLQAKYRQRLRDLEEASYFLQESCGGAESASSTENLPYLRRIDSEALPDSERTTARSRSVRATTFQTREPDAIRVEPNGKGGLIIAFAVLAIVGAVAGWWFGVEQPKQDAERKQQQAKVEAQQAAATETQKKLDAANARAEEAERQKQTAEKREQEVATIAKARAEQTAVSARVVVNTIPSRAQVTLDGEPRGFSPLIIENVASGSRRLVLTRAGYDSVELILDVSPGKINDLGTIQLVQKHPPESQPSAPQPVTAAAASAPTATRSDETVRTLIRKQLNAVQRGDAATMQECYATPVDYFDEGLLNENQLRESFSKFRRFWPSFGISEMSEITVNNTGDPDVLTVSYAYRYTARNSQSGKVASGISHCSVTVRWIGSQPAIIRIRETVTDRKKNY